MTNSIIGNDQLIAEFAEESNTLLEEIEGKVTSLENNPENINSIFRAIHSVKGSAGILGLTNIGRLTHNLETVLDLIRSKQLAADENVVDLLLEGLEQLNLLFENVSASYEVDLSQIQDRLDHFLAEQSNPDTSNKIDPPLVQEPLKDHKETITSSKKILIIEDELINREFLEQAIIELTNTLQIVSVDSAAKGLYHFFTGSFDLIFLDIMMPGIDGSSFIRIVEENLKEGLIQDRPNIVVQTAIQSMDKLQILAQNECVQEIIRKPIKVDRIQECVYRYC